MLVYEIEPKHVWRYLSGITCDYAGVIHGNGCECMSLNVCKYVMLTVAHVGTFKQTVAYVYVGLHVYVHAVDVHICDM